jgi:hypothetical protein
MRQNPISDIFEGKIIPLDIFVRKMDSIQYGTHKFGNVATDDLSIIIEKWAVYFRVGWDFRQQGAVDDSFGGLYRKSDDD